MFAPVAIRGLEIRDFPVDWYDVYSEDIIQEMAKLSVEGYRHRLDSMDYGQPGVAATTYRG
jgi:hypothetical protein